MNIITAVYNFLWGDLITLPLPGGSSIGISLLVLLLVPAGIYFTIRTRFVLIRRFPHMIQIAMEKNEHSQAGSISGFQALIVATATRVGMGNLVGVVAAISAGGAGAVFWICGFLLCLAPPLLLQRAHWLRSTARRIRSTAATAAVRPTTSTIL